MKYLLFFLLCNNLILAQNYPQNFFASPLAIDLSINGSFGELRYNHFHSGLDFGSNRKVGAPVFASADAEIIRIHINEKGFGKAIYLKHANGFTTVYAHLDSYADEIQNYVKLKQYKEQKYAIEIFPLKNELLVKKGDVIGYLGNTGSSAGPHLHFEIRDTQTEEIINPFLFGFDNMIEDIQKPIVNALLVYPVTNESVVNNETVPIILNLTKLKDGVYVSQKVEAKGVIGFGVNAYDVMNNKYSKNGIYKFETFLNGSKNLEIIFDRFNFDETRNINLFLDYQQLALTKQRVQKMFKSTNFDLSFFKEIKNEGKIDVQKDDSYNYKIIISDFHKNTTEINVPIDYYDSEVNLISENKQNLKHIDSKRDYIFSENNGTLEWNALTFYNDCDLEIGFSENEIKLHKDVFPLDKSITLKFDLNDSKLNVQRSFIGLVNGNSISHFFTWRNNNILSIRTKTLGTYKVIEDFYAPVVTPINFSENNILTLIDVLIFEVVDDSSGIKEINGFINDDWALFEYEYKTKQIIHHLKDGVAKKGLNKVTINVTDNVGNNVIFESNFQLN